MRIVVFEPRDFGHFVFFHAMHAQVLHDMGHDVLMVSGASREELMAAVPTLRLDPSRMYRFKQCRWKVMRHRKVRRFRNQTTDRRLRKVLSRIEQDNGIIDWVFLSSIEKSWFSGSTGLLALSAQKWTGLSLRTSLIRNKDNDVISEFIRMKNAGARAICSLDEGVSVELGRKAQLPVVFHPDVGSFSPACDGDSHLNVDIVNFARGRFVVGLLGAIQSRKNLKLFLDLLECMDRDRYFFVLMGRIEAATSSEDRDRLKRLMQKTPENIYIKLERIASEEEFVEVCRAIDLHFAAYIDFSQSSNIQGKAAFVSKPCLVSDGYLMAERNRQFRLGPVLYSNRLQDASKAIDLCSTKEWQEHWRKTNRCAEYLEVHSVEGVASMFKRLETILG